MTNRPSLQLDPVVRLLLALAFVTVVVSTPAPAFRLFGLYGAIALLGSFATRICLRVALKRVLLLLPFVALAAVFIPFLPQRPTEGAEWSRWLVLWNVTIKSLLCGTTLIILGLSTPFGQLTGALERLRVPRLFVLLLGFCYRYLFVLRDEAVRMLRASQSRGYQGRWLHQVVVIGYLLGTLFLRSYERGERVYLAMLSRGFDLHCAPPQAGIPGRDCAVAIAAFSLLLVLRFYLA